MNFLRQTPPKYCEFMFPDSIVLLARESKGNNCLSGTALGGQIDVLQKARAADCETRSDALP
jgi:hypothetical protein